MRSKNGFFRLSAVLLILLALGLAIGTMGALAATYEDYNESWNLPLQPEDGIVVDMSAVNVIIERYEQAELAVVFEGKRSPASNGEMPYIAVEQKNGQVSVKSVWPKQSFLDFSSGELEGTLTILVPEVQLSSVSVNTFSGNVSAENLSAKDFSIDTSSGNVSAKNLDVSGAFSIGTFFGTHLIEAIRATDVTLDASSGSITASDVQAAGSFNANTFSGNQSCTDVTAGSVFMEASSGNLTGIHVRSAGDFALSTFSGKQDMQDIEAATISATASSGNVSWADAKGISLAVETFSGTITLTQASFDEEVSLSTSSRDITIDGLTASLLELNTFSGSIHADRVDVNVLNANTSSGNCFVVLAGNADVAIETFSGDVGLTFPAGTGMGYEYDTFSGKATINAPDAGSEKDGSSVTGTIGDGASTVRVNTSSGDLNIAMAE